jgi:hypothetical protein
MTREAKNSTTPLQTPDGAAEFYTEAEAEAFAVERLAQFQGPLRECARRVC